MPLNYPQVVSKILDHLQDHKLKTFDIIFQPEEIDTSPVLCVEHNLGIESWCVKNLYLQAYDTVFKHPGPDSVHYDASVLTLLLLNPNIKTLWNKRRTFVSSGKSSVDFELNFIKLVLSFKPKSQDALNYRKWLLKFHHLITYQNFVQKDLPLILDAASRHTNNHVAWDYGIWYLNSVDTQTLAKLCIMLWDETATWINTNVSDYSALHFRQFLIEKLTDKDLLPLIDYSFKKKTMLAGLEFAGSVLKVSDEDVIVEVCQKFETPDYGGFYLLGILLVDFEINEKLISFYVDHEALWNHRRFLCYHFHRVLPTALSDKSKRLFSTLVREIVNMNAEFSYINESNLFEFLFLKIHRGFLDKCQNVETESGRYSVKYIEWLKKCRILNLSDDGDFRNPSER
ncbi:protein prenyltransferase alpha subunit repeat-containing protein 1-like [Planococcus citri]|uniref:protein prenyltransferase alpha subunit repeat-containing protein 1-like n=1 Tax=Planococcus citri TaxID=170843 RepID=UPI0031F8D23F